MKLCDFQQLPGFIFLRFI